MIFTGIDIKLNQSPIQDLQIQGEKKSHSGADQQFTLLLLLLAVRRFQGTPQELPLDTHPLSA